MTHLRLSRCPEGLQRLGHELDGDLMPLCSRSHRRPHRVRRVLERPVEPLPVTAVVDDDAQCVCPWSPSAVPPVPARPTPRHTLRPRSRRKQSVVVRDRVSIDDGVSQGSSLARTSGSCWPSRPARTSVKAASALRWRSRPSRLQQRDEPFEPVTAELLGSLLLLHFAHLHRRRPAAFPDNPTPPDRDGPAGQTDSKLVWSGRGRLAEVATARSNQPPVHSSYDAG